MIRENSERIVRTRTAALRDLDAEHLLDGPHVPDAVDHRGDVVQAVRVGDHLVPGVRLRHLLEAAVQIPDLRFGPRDPLAVQPRDQVNDAVGRGVRRPDRDRLRLEVPGPLVGLLRPGGHLQVLLGEEPALARRVVLAQRMADEGVVAQDAPAGSGAPENRSRRGRRPPARTSWRPARRRSTEGSAGGAASGRRTLTRTCSLRGSECRWTTASKRVFCPGALQVVHARQIQKEVVAAVRVVAEEARQGRPVRRSDLQRRQIEVADLDPLRERASRARRSRILSAAARKRRGRDGAQAGLFRRAACAERLSRDSSPDLIFRCSSRIPKMSSSGVGGQPGT